MQDILAAIRTPSPFDYGRYLCQSCRMKLCYQLPLADFRGPWIWTYCDVCNAVGQCAKGASKALVVC